METLLVFVIIAILANVFDKKKPPVKLPPKNGQQFPDSAGGHARDGNGNYPLPKQADSSQQQPNVIEDWLAKLERKLRETNPANRTPVDVFSNDNDSVLSSNDSSRRKDGSNRKRKKRSQGSTVAPSSDSSVAEPAEAVNPYQAYYAAHGQQQDADKAAYKPECEAPYDGSHAQHEHYHEGNVLRSRGAVPLAQAVVLSEIIGRPRAQQSWRNRRYR